MSVKIRLKRFGTKKRPYYRVVVIDSHLARDGKTLDEIGLFHPIEKEGKQLKLDITKVDSWISKGATPSPTVSKLINKARIAG